ncbi:MAG: single-stranded DNA-binding protein [Streptosporangiales bacterium]|nr:single-stranded DNA-binding protein [Streptosporangiales bacterium]
MSNQTYVKLTGWVAKDPDLRVTNKDHTPVCTVRVGTASRWLDRSAGEWREGPASYYDVVCWRGLAVNAASSLRKGHRVTVHGSFRTKTWTDRDNNTRTEVEINASSLGHDLLFGWTHFNRIRSASPQSAEGIAAGEASRGLGAEPEFGPSENYGPGPGFGPGHPERSPFDEDCEADVDPAVRPASEPDGGRDGVPGDEPGAGRVFGTGDESDADTAEAAAGDPRREDVAVPV